MDDCISDFSMEFSESNIFDGVNGDTESNSTDKENDITGSNYDIWEMINDKMDCKNVSGNARKNTGSDLLLYFFEMQYSLAS